MLWAALGTLAIVSVVSAASYRIAREGLRREIISRLESVAQSRAKHVETFLTKHREQVELAATSVVLRDGLQALETGPPGRATPVEDMNLRLRRFLDPAGHISQVLLLDHSGRVVAATDAEDVGLDMSTDASFFGARGGAFIKDAYRAQTTGRHLLAISAPVLADNTGELLGVVVTQLDMVGLNAICTDRTGLGEAGETYIINRDGYMITPSRFGEDTFLKQKVATANARRCLADIEAVQQGETPPAHDAIQFAGYRGVPVVGTCAHVMGMPWVLMAEMDAAAALAPVSRLRTILTGWAAALGAAALALAYLASLRIVRTLHELHAGAERIGAGELGYRLDIRTGDELEQLAGEFNRMAGKLAESRASLEAQVAERTNELAQANEQLTEQIADRKRSEERATAIIQTAIDGFMLTDMNGRLLDVNDAYCRIIGYSRAELLAMSIPDVEAAEDREQVAEHMRRMDEQGYDRFETQHRRKDGRIIDVEVSAMPLPADQRYFVVFLRDITERKRAEQEREDLVRVLAEANASLDQLNSMLQRSNKDLEQFAYVISHDLQEPLRTVGSFVQLLAKRYKGTLDAEGDEFIAFAIDGVKRMHALIGDLLQYSRVTSRGREPQPTDAQTALDIALASLTLAVEDSGALVTHDPLPTVKADPGQLAELMQNLIGNAIKFHGEEAPRVHVSATRQGGEWMFAVRDNGIGIAAESAERIFMVFQRLHTRDEYAGTGIGLAICKKIVERHGGRIWVESEPGKGTTLYFTMPASDSPSAPPQRSAIERSGT
jgi:PAS domain S-box-containing protein